MTIQEILDAIDAEIEAKRESARKIQLFTLKEMLIHSAYIDGLRFAKDMLIKQGETSGSVPAWQQTVNDSEQILCQSGELLQECYDKFSEIGQKEMAEKILAFCNRVHHCMTSGRKWEDT